MVGRTRYDSEVTRVAQLVKNIAHGVLEAIGRPEMHIENTRLTRQAVDAWFGTTDATQKVSEIARRCAFERF